MKSKWLALLLAASLAVAGVESFRPALPGYRYEFPRDYFNHQEYQTEWWYYTGNLRTPGGRRFGFELTFFRQGIDRAKKEAANVWDARDVWLAHLALSDIDGQQFFHTERLNRAGPGLAGADEKAARVWNGNWEALWQLDPQAPGGVASERLQAVADRFGFVLSLSPAKPPVIHGTGGVSQKSAGAGHASHYFSQTRLNTHGKVNVGGQEFAVEGLAWMDHEFFTHQLASNQTGWDWFSLQFDDGSELMLFRLRSKEAAADPYSSGTYIDPLGKATHLVRADFSLTPGKTWPSPVSSGRYPVEWRIQVYPLGLDLALRTRLPQQELAGSNQATSSYWEGAVEVTGARKGRTLRGLGYLEMTGYAGAINFGG